MLWFVLGCFFAYSAIGALTGGFIHRLKENECRWDWDDSAWIGVGWPVSFFWYFFLKPITKSGIYIAEAKEKRRRRLQQIREQLEAVERERQLEIQKHIRELEAEEAEYHEAQRQVSA